MSKLLEHFVIRTAMAIHIAVLVGSMVAAENCMAQSGVLNMAQSEVLNMSAKLSQPLAELVKAAEAHGSSASIAVIVTLAAGANAARLSAEGFQPKILSESAGIVSMSLSAKEIRRLAASDAVRLIEPDGQVHAD